MWLDTWGQYGMQEFIESQPLMLYEYISIPTGGWSAVIHTVCGSAIQVWVALCKRFFFA